MSRLFKIYYIKNLFFVLNITLKVNFMSNELCIYVCPACKDMNTEITINKLDRFQVMQINQANGNCSTITFEGADDLSPISDINLGFTVVQFPGWLGLIDSDEGGSGNIAFEPSLSTTAFWLSDLAFNIAYRDIVFTEPVCKVELFYASFYDVNLSAYDENNVLLGSINGLANWNQGPGGDPSGDYNKWDPLVITLDSNQISRVRFTGYANFSVIDNLSICVCSRGLIIES